VGVWLDLQPGLWEATAEALEENLKLHLLALRCIYLEDILKLKNGEQVLAIVYSNGAELHD
jgi:hypothetical protein